ncbi:MAG: PEP-utilizing protein mobile region [Deltaproteobacteria bacterium]|nr:PEP-utilizing protein mobile region [Deltaproteobacteria bacterium]
MWVRSLGQSRPASDATSAAASGGKATGLLRLIAAGLPVPDGFVIEDHAFRAVVDGEQLPAELVREVSARAAELGVVVVRSSASIEDRAGTSGAGVFASIVGVPASEVWAAIHAVWNSARTPLAASYARQRGDHGGPADDPTARCAMAVIVQRFVPGERVTVYTRPPGAPRIDELWVQRGDRLAKQPRGAPGPLGELALQAEQAIEAHEGADVELVLGEQPWLVQARPITHPVPRVQRPPPPSVIAPLVADGRVWTWDIAHNPDPLSTAQAGLVERVDRAGIAPWSLRVCAGYLYTAPARHGAAEPAAVASRAELDRRAGSIEAKLARCLEAPEPGATIEHAIARYLEIYRIWACELVPLIRSARRGLAPEMLPGARPSAVELTLLAAARGELAVEAVLDRLGVLAPAWDVAVPTFGERPALIHDAIARARGVLGRSPGPHPDRESPHELARAAADLAERDDVWFARAQWLVRRAILDKAHALELDPEDASWLPLDELAAATTLDRDDARRRAAAARDAAERTRDWMMPLVVGAPPPTPGRALVGVGGTGRVTGRVVRLSSLAATVAVGHGDVVVTRAVTPALAVTVMGCAGIVSETGGPLDHGAALARELGIPCIVGCHDAWSLLTDGMIVTLDGDVVVSY